jgi:hypothetical protein
MATALNAVALPIARELKAVMERSEPHTLVTIEDHLTALYDTLDLIEDPALRAEAEAEIAAYEEAEIRKVDGICRYLAFADAQVEMEAGELKRHQSRKQSWERRIERLYDSIYRVMVANQKSKLEGTRGNSLLLRPCPASVEVVDETLATIPQEYIRVSVTESVDKIAAKKVLQAGEEITGLKLVTDRKRVERK